LNPLVARDPDRIQLARPSPRSGVVGGRRDDAVTQTAGEEPTRRLVGEGIRYLVAGGLITLFYLGIYGALLAFGVQYFVAILCAQVVTIALAFPTYRRFVFGPGESLARDFVRFASVWVGGAVAGLIGTPLLVELFQWNPFLGQVLAIVVVTMANFLIHRFWTFAPRRPRADHVDGADAP
jgi:putative flippase GtrA